MGEEITKTGVDELLELLQNGPKITIVDAAKKLDVPMDVLQAWVDFLVEENIIGIEYKFTTPYIYSNNPISKDTVIQKNIEVITSESIKKEFIEKARKNSIPESQVDALWKNHIMQELELRKKYFYSEAMNRKLQGIDALWQEYCSIIMNK